MPWFFSGNVRMRLPVALKNAFRTAGAATQIVGSPMPPQNPPDGRMTDSTFGICAIRIESKVSKFCCSMRPALTVHSSMKSADNPYTNDPAIWRSICAGLTGGFLYLELDLSGLPC